MKNLVLVVLGFLLSPQRARSWRDEKANCKPVTASFCQGVGYTTTLHPSGVLGYSLQQIGQMVQTACSPNIATLMCRVVVPECNPEDDSRVKPCRALCEKVKTDCESALKAKRLSWPTRLRCETLPESNCVQVSLEWRGYPLDICFGLYRLFQELVRHFGQYLFIFMPRFRWIHGHFHFCTGSLA